ncbi:MAG: replication initiation protein [Ghiorsea sp.]|nr:replication initiation protein [Ghiorsea sp.]
MNKQIVKHNAAIKASYRLTLDEQRLMMLCISQVRRDNRTNPRRFTIRHQDYCKEFGTSYAYKNMKEAAMRLQQRVIKVGKTEIDGVVYDGGAINVLSRQMWKEGEGEIMLDFSEFFMPYLERLSADFTRFGLKDIAQMTSIYSIRIYELLKMADGQQKSSQSKTIYEIKKQDMRDMFELGTKYKAHKDFRKYIIDIAVREINQFSPLNVELEQIKKGRLIHAFKFTVTRKSADIKPKSKAEKRILKELETIKMAFKIGHVVKVNGNEITGLSGDYSADFGELGRHNLYNELKAGATFKIE